MSNGYDINSINALGSDPMFLAALQAYNPNFMGTQQVQATQIPQTVTTPQVATTQTQALPKADYSEGSDSSTGMVLGLGAVAAGAATLIYAAKKGNGEGFIKGFKNIFKSKDAVKEVAEAVTGGAKKTAPLENIRVMMKGGKPVYYIPGKTTTAKNATEIQNLINNNSELKKLTGLRFRTGETNITAGTFRIKSGSQEYSITFDGKKVTKIEQLTGKGKGNITDKYIDKDGKFLDKFKDDAMQEKADTFSERLNKILQGDFAEISSKETNLSNFTYTTKMGDSTAKITRKQISTHGAPKDNITINELTTLKEFKADDDAVLAYVRTARESGNNVDSIIGKDFLKNGKLPDGYKVHEFTIKDNGHDVKIVDGKVDSIYIDGKWHKKGSEKCEAYLERGNRAEVIEKRITKKLKNNAIPDGATIIAA